MRFRQTVLTTLSGFAVYFGMAACTGNDGQIPHPTPAAGDDPAARETPPLPTWPTPLPSPVPNAMADTWYASGTRLKIRYLEGVDGSKQFVGWYDALRSETCTFARHIDGSTRCIPPTGGTLLNFSDAACSVEIAHIAKGSPQPKYAGRAETAGLRVRSVVGVYPGTVYARSSFDGSCGAANFLRDNWDFYSAGSEMASTEFVEGAVKTAP
jgi:hypothetical protein